MCCRRRVSLCFCEGVKCQIPDFQVCSMVVSEKQMNSASSEWVLRLKGSCQGRDFTHAGQERAPVLSFLSSVLLKAHPALVAVSQFDRHLESEVQKRAILGCCVWVKWAGLITAHYSSARCHNTPAGVTRCGVVAFLPDETKMQCTIGCVIWPSAPFMPQSHHRGCDLSVILTSNKY